MRWEARAAAQDALVTRRQLLDEMTPAAVRWLLDDGRLVPLRRGVYAVAGAPPSPWRALRAALLAAGDAVASHRAAAALQGFPGVLPGAVEITVFARRAPRGAPAHTAGVLHAEDICRVAGLPATSAARTLVDLAAHPRLAPMLDHCLDRRLCTVADVDGCIERLGRGPRRLQALLDDRRHGGESALECTWLLRLRRAGLPKPVVAYQLVVGTRVLVLDLAWPAHRVGVEVDGWSAHRTRSRFDADRERDLVAMHAGWTLLHVTSRTPVQHVVSLLGHKLL